MFQAHIILSNQRNPCMTIQCTGACCHKIASGGLRGIETSPIYQQLQR
jgi:hypothetical protein